MFQHEWRTQNKPVVRPRRLSQCAQFFTALIVITFLAGCPSVFDPCTGMNCDDDDPCTTDSCSGASCLNETIESCCNEDAECDDSDPCTEDACADGNICASSPIADCCNSDTDCDTGEICEENLCILVDRGCESDEDCGQDELCDTVTGTCMVDGHCTTSSDCDDGNACTVDACDEATGLCGNERVNCNDGVDCTVDSCDPATGECTHPSNCADDEICDFSTGQCVLCLPCTTDADCPDDGVFCTGTESCDETTGCCESSGDPCALNDPCDGRYCDEEYDICNSCPSDYSCDPFFPLTLELDDFIGSSCDDSISAPLIFNFPTGTIIPSLQTGDRVDGRDGMDVLYVQFNFSAGPATVAPMIINIETLVIIDFGTSPTTLSAEDITGTTAVNSLNSTNPLAPAVTNLAYLVDVSLINTSSGVTISYAAETTGGLADGMYATLSDTNGGTLTIASETANGIEMLNITSTGAPNTLTAVSQTVGTSLTTVVITGDVSLVITNALPSSVVMISAANASGGVSIDASDAEGGVTMTGSPGNDNLFGSARSDSMTSGGGSNFLVSGASVDSLVLGSGIDIIQIGVAGADGVDRNLVSSFVAGTGGDKIIIDSDDLAMLDGTDNFASASSIQEHVTAGNLTVAPGAEVVRVPSNALANFNDANSLNGTNLVAGIGGIITVQQNENRHLFLISDSSGNTGVYFGAAGADLTIDTDELTLIAVLQDVSINDLVVSNFANAP